MRNFFSHWKILLALVLLILLAVITISPDDASADASLGQRLRQHVLALDSAGLEHAARHIETSLAAYGYRVQRSQYQAGVAASNIEASLPIVEPGARPSRMFIVGTNDLGSGTAAVLELARLLKGLRPAAGTELKFVFFAPSGPGQRASGTGNFIAFAGSRASSERVREAVAAFRTSSEFPPQGLAAPAYVQGVTLSSHSPYGHSGYPAVMVTDTAFMRYPYHPTAGDAADQPDYDSMARVLAGLARTISALAGGARS